MKKTTMIAAAVLCSWSALSSGQDLKYESFKELAGDKLETLKAQAKPKPQPRQDEEHPHWPVYTTESIRAACRHLGNLGLSEDGCLVYCRVPIDPDGFHNVSEFSDYFYYECSMTSIRRISPAEEEVTICSGSAVVSKLDNRIVASADVGRRGRPDVRKTDDKPSCATTRRPYEPEPPAPIPF